jgi:hypothetical protein
MSKFSTAFCVAALAVFATAAFADDTDPALFQDAPVGCGPYWCTSAGTGYDPKTGDSTLEFILNAGSAGHDGITTPFVTGVVQFKYTGSAPGVVGASKVLDDLDFEVINNQDVIFLYCGNLFCGTNDAGLPSVAVTPNVTISTSSTPVAWIAPTVSVPNPVEPANSNTPNYVPTTGQPGYGTAYTPNANGIPGYEVIYAGSTSGVGQTATVPEPSAVLLLGIMMIGVTGFARRKFSARG